MAPTTVGGGGLPGPANGRTAEPPPGVSTPPAPDPADVALGLGVLAALDHAADIRRALPGDTELAFHILTDPDPDPAD
ncbi:hypothetical protein [Streptomyces sp. NPDC049879]|uniref:hypothetical protein n=1 Tax=Streptomyces sp. NPDC049879 TaxID=3365598 RepID=UPI00379651D7